MEAEILLRRKPNDAEGDPEEDSDLLKNLEEKVSDLLRLFRRSRERGMAWLRPWESRKRNQPVWRGNWNSFPKSEKK